MGVTSFEAEDFLRSGYEPASDSGSDFDSIFKGRVESVVVESPSSLRFVGYRGGNRNEFMVRYRPSSDVDVSDDQCYRNGWFDSLPDGVSKHLRFINCVFSEELVLDDPYVMEFTHCVFMKGVSVTGMHSSDRIVLTSCIVRGQLSIDTCKVNTLRVDGCNIGGMTLRNSRVNGELEVRGSFFTGSITLRNCLFSGSCVELKELSMDSDLEMFSCISICPVGVSLCRLSDLRVSGCKFDTLDVNGVHCYNHVRSDANARICSRDSDIPGMMFKNVIVNNVTSLMDMVSSRIDIMDCIFKNDCIIDDRDPDPSDTFFDGIASYGLTTMEPQEYDIDVLALSNSRFLGNLSVANMYRYMCLDGTMFDGTVDMDLDYASVLKGSVIRRMDHDCRLYADDGRFVDSSTLLSISEAMYRNRKYIESERWYIAYRVRQRYEGNGFDKCVSLAHELVSGFGKSPSRIFVTSVVILMVFSVCYFLAGLGDLGDCMYMSGITFFTIGYGEVGIMDPVSKSLAITEGGFGLVMMAYLVTVMCNRKR